MSKPMATSKFVQGLRGQDDEGVKMAGFILKVIAGIVQESRPIPNVRISSGFKRKLKRLSLLDAERHNPRPYCAWPAASDSLRLCSSTEIFASLDHSGTREGSEVAGDLKPCQTQPR